MAFHTVTIATVASCISYPIKRQLLVQFEREQGTVEASVLQLSKYTHPHKDWGTLQVDSIPIDSLPPYLKRRKEKVEKKIPI